MDASRSRPWWSLRCSDFGFQPDSPGTINVPQCGINPVLYFIYRSFVFIYFITYMIYDLVTTINGFDGVRTFIYLTTWVYLMFNLYVLVSFINTLLDAYNFFRLRERQVEVTPRRLRFQWFLFNLVLNGTIVISFAFWILYLVSPTLRIFLPNMLRNINLHLLPAIFSAVDLLTTAVPVRFAHVIYPIIFGLVYLVFTVVYWKTGGTNPWGLPFIYPSLDFDDDPNGAWIFALEMIGASLLCQAVVKGLYLLREWTTHKVNPYSSLDGINTEDRTQSGSNIALSDR